MTDSLNKLAQAFCDTVAKNVQNSDAQVWLFVQDNQVTFIARQFIANNTGSDFMDNREITIKFDYVKKDDKNSGIIAKIQSTADIRSIGKDGDSAVIIMHAGDNCVVTSNFMKALVSQISDQLTMKKDKKEGLSHVKRTIETRHETFVENLDRYISNIKSAKSSPLDGYTPYLVEAVDNTTKIDYFRNVVISHPELEPIVLTLRSHTDLNNAAESFRRLSVATQTPEFMKNIGAPYDMTVFRSVHDIDSPTNIHTDNEHLDDAIAELTVNVERQVEKDCFEFSSLHSMLEEHRFKTDSVLIDGRLFGARENVGVLKYFYDGPFLASVMPIDIRVVFDGAEFSVLGSDLLGNDIEYADVIKTLAAVKAALEVENDVALQAIGWLR